MKSDYKKIADFMETNAVDLKVQSSAEFKELCKRRKLQFIKVIDVANGSRREVWGNRTFEIIVKHNMAANEYIVL